MEPNENFRRKNLSHKQGKQLRGQSRARSLPQVPATKVQRRNRCRSPLTFEFHKDKFLRRHFVNLHIGRIVSDSPPRRKQGCWPHPASSGHVIRSLPNCVHTFPILIFHPQNFIPTSLILAITHSALESTRCQADKDACVPRHS